MQVTINPINATSKEVILIVEPERIEKYYKKYLSQAAKEAVVPGFRKGKAPLAMVERMYADRIEDYFQKDVVDDAFGEASKEHDIHYLLYPEVKDIEWEKGKEMVIKIEIETEPQIEFKSLDGLKIPFQPLQLDDQVTAYIEELRTEHAVMVDVETAVAEDEVNCEISFEVKGTPYTTNYSLYAGDSKPFRSFPELIGTKTGDQVEVELSGKFVMYGLASLKADPDPEQYYPAKLMVNSVMRNQVPALDDEFAKDLEFDNLEQMRAKIAGDMSLKNEHQNINIKNNAVISHLFTENNFDLPMKTLEYLAQQQVESITDESLKKYYLGQIRMQIAQEMIHVYIMNNLRKAMNPEIGEEQVSEYMTHQAILEDLTLEAWKEAHKKDIEDEEFAEVAKNYHILKNLADKSEFFVPEPVNEEDAEEATTEDTEA